MSSRTLPAPRLARPLAVASKRLRARSFGVLLGVLALLLFLSLTIALTIGPVPLAARSVWEIALAQLSGRTVERWSAAEIQIVWLIRFPRLLLAGIVGAGLAVVGATLQALVRNPLADPYLLGISSGASVGAVLVFLLGVLAPLGPYALSTGAFLGALVAFSLVFLLARSEGRVTPARLILAGVAISYLGSAITSFLTLTANQNAVRSVLFWLMGGFSGTTWADLPLPAFLLLAGTGYLLLQAPSLNALSMGEESAITLGIDVESFRRRLFVVTSLLTGVMVAASGAIGFVGLMLPHMVRLVVGGNHRRLLPVCALAGAIFLIWVDVLARVVLAPVELPVGIITSLVGAPFFVWLLRRRRQMAGGSL